MAISFIPGDINFDHQVKVVSARLLHCKITTFPCVIYKYLVCVSGGGYLRLCKYHVSSTFDPRVSACTEDDWAHSISILSLLLCSHCPL